MNNFSGKLKNSDQTTPEGQKAIQAVKAMKYLQAKNIPCTGMDEDQILNLSALTAAFQGSDKINGLEESCNKLNLSVDEKKQALVLAEKMKNLKAGESIQTPYCETNLGNEGLSMAQDLVKIMKSLNQ